MYSPQLQFTPLFALTSSTNDISMLLYFYFGNLFIFGMGSPLFFCLNPRKSVDVLLALQHVGHAMTFKVLADNSQKSFSVLPSALLSRLGSRTCELILLVGSHLPS